MMSKHSSTASRKYLLCAVLFVLLTLPHTSEAFGGFNFGDDNDGGAASSHIARQRVTEKRFKFRKIERISIEDDEEDDDDDDDKSDLSNAANDNNDDDDDDDDDEAAKDAAADVVNTRRAAASSSSNADEEFQYERAHRAQKLKKHPLTPHGGTEQRMQQSPPQSQRRTDVHKQKESITPQPSGGFGAFFTSWFGSTDKADKVAESKQRKKHAADDDDDDNNGNKEIIASNSIIDWLKWLGEKTGHIKPPAPPAPKSTTLVASLLSYLDRWPFNTLIPFSKPPKPIRVPARAVKRGASEDCSDSAAANAASTAPMSQDHFESLLHTLPGFVVNASHVSDVECRQQLQIFHRQLRGNKLWTLQMLDASGKISSGLLRGNINQFGDFDLCTQVKTKVKVTPDIPMRIRGKYCLAHIETHAAVPELKVPVHLAHGRALWNSHLGNPSHLVPRYGIANWGICLPHECSAQVVQEMIETNLRPYNQTGVEFHVDVHEHDCYVRQSSKFTKLLRKDEKFAMTTICIGTLLSLMLAAGLIDCWPQLQRWYRSLMGACENKESTNNEEKFTSVTSESEEVAESEEVTESEEVAVSEENNEEATALEDQLETSADLSSWKYLLSAIFKSFSPVHTLAELLSLERSDVEFPIFHLLKLAATFMLYVCLKYLMIGHLPITNRDKLVRTVDQSLSVLFRSPMIYCDVLLLTSGFLAAYQLAQEMEQRSCIQLLKRLAAKVLRYLPLVYMVLLFQTWILPHLGAGPLWSNLVGQHANLCAAQMWRNLLGVQNAIDFEETCSPMTVQLALELQLYLLAPLIVWLYYTDADAGFFIYGGFHAMSVAARYARTHREHLSMTLFHGMNVSKFYRSANILYASPISRATPYLLGIGAGILYRSEAGCLDIPPELVPIGWLLSLLSIVWCFWSPAAGMHSDYIYNASDAAAYASWSPLLLGMAIAWMVLMFPRSEQSVLRPLATSRPVLFLSRITFPMQLVMYIVVLYSTASVKDAGKYHISDLINPSEIVLIVVIASALAFLIDVPAQNIRRLLVNRLFMERVRPDGEEPTSGAEQSDGEMSEEQNEAVACETPEPTEKVWASDPEEEEQKYLARRRSSSTPAETLLTEKNMSEIKKDEHDDDDVEKEEEVIVEEEEEVEEEELDEDIAEEAEVMRRPPTPPPPVEQKITEETETTRRRRRPTSDD